VNLQKLGAPVVQGWKTWKGGSWLARRLKWEGSEESLASQQPPEKAKQCSRLKDSFEFQHFTWLSWAITALQIHHSPSIFKIKSKLHFIHSYITFFKRGAASPSQQCKRASNSIQDPPHWILTIFKLKLSGGNLFSPAMTSTIEGNNSVGSLLDPLLKKVTPVVGSRMLCT
jgi:hypothetical protein